MNAHAQLMQHGSLACTMIQAGCAQTELATVEPLEDVYGSVELTPAMRRDLERELVKIEDRRARIKTLLGAGQ